MKVRAIILTAAVLLLPLPKLGGQEPNQSHEVVATRVRLTNQVQGPALFDAYCASCHGKTGKGDGPMAPALKARIPDLTHISSRNAGRFPLDRVQKIILGEAQAPFSHGTREMPVWGPIFSEVTRDRDIGRLRAYNVAKYLEQMQSSH